ncbi:MAG: M14 family metallopeptidase [Bacteroidetes bacterium]|nr:M14 family metallopeptidase [Bacteroidota bacterium]
MKKIVLLCFLCGTVFAQMASKYHNYNDLTKALQQITFQYSSLVNMESIVKMEKGHEVWVVTIGKGVAENKKAILVVGGIEAASLVGSEYALRFIEHLAQSYGKNDSITSMLEQTTVYVIARANPDASESFFTKPLAERETNVAPYDDDRDAAIDEDDVDDVNKDGIISLMRVKDSRGEWIIHPDDSRLMKKADPAKGEKGSYRVLTEGIDNDKDDEWNEDPVGGTDFNRNFTYNFQFFSKNSGVHQISENATRALANFVFDHPNIGMIFTFSSNDNLMMPWKNEPPKGEGAVITSVTKDDEEYYGFISKKFSEITKLKDAPKPAKGEGALSEWGYYHAGRWSFATRPWWPAELPKIKDTIVVNDSTKQSLEGKKDNKEKSDDPIVNMLKWYDAVGVKDIAVQWKSVKHPDFPEQEVEIGGVKPFVLINPPAESLNSYSRSYLNFLTFLAAQLPTISFANQKVEKIGNNVYRVSIDVVNNGFLPTNSSLGVKTRWVRNVRVQCDAGKSATLSSGKTKQVLDPLKGSGGFQSISWIVIGKGSIMVKADSPVAGGAETKIDLK